MKHILSTVVLCAVTHSAFGADTDGDGLLDLLDVAGFSTRRTGYVDFSSRGIQDLDGANLLTNAIELNLAKNQITSVESGDFEGLDNLGWLNLSLNQITSVESGDFEGLGVGWLDLSFNQITSLANVDFDGLDNLQILALSGRQIANVESGAFGGLDNLGYLNLGENQITSIESGAFGGFENLQTLDLGDNQLTSIDNGVFQGLHEVQTLWLFYNPLTQLNLAGASLSSLRACSQFYGFCIDSEKITNLILDHAFLSQRSFRSIVRETKTISDVSLVGLDFSDQYPSSLGNLLSIETLANVQVDQALFDRYATEFSVWDTIEWHTVTIVLPADADGDGTVSLEEFNILKTHFGMSC